MREKLKLNTHLHIIPDHLLENQVNPTYGVGEDAHTRFQRQRAITPFLSSAREKLTHIFTSYLTICKSYKSIRFMELEELCTQDFNIKGQ